MLRLLAFALVASAGAQPSVAAAQARQPTGKWVVHFDDSRCLAERNYGTSSSPLYLTLKQPPMGSVAQLSVALKKPLRLPEQHKAVLRLGDQQPLETTAVAFRREGQELAVYQLNVPLDRLNRAAASDRMQIQAGGLDETFALSGLQPLLNVMGKCVEDLRQAWNVDSESASGSKVSPDPGGRLASLFTASDYPEDALSDSAGGTVEMAILVDENGQVADCSVIQTSGVAILDAQSCAIMRERAKFSPAVGPGGKNVKSSFVQRINWQTQ